ncbi:hypothetical protein IE077_000886 [Cardiosporidium cionae]|uniref:Kinesin motor domain-containing protein n=1 Tax=Cardiosporidium cionae TaxID=476202 RepID=A0ABQ7J6A5_9APIC|nr:hypothetical protein IE077_000886 [Cardiosporidium cionae]|eukprot:KAF8819530.1 hypothetical protein IE077_000886 [Cardiosporidium cionae]
MGMNSLKTLEETHVGKKKFLADNVLREVLIRQTKILNLQRLCKDTDTQIQLWKHKFFCNHSRQATEADQRIFIPNLIMKNRRFKLWLRTQQRELRRKLVEYQLLPIESSCQLELFGEEGEKNVDEPSPGKKTHGRLASSNPRFFGESNATESKSMYKIRPFRAITEEHECSLPFLMKAFEELHNISKFVRALENAGDTKSVEGESISTKLVEKLEEVAAQIKMIMSSGCLCVKTSKPTKCGTEKSISKKQNFYNYEDKSFWLGAPSENSVFETSSVSEASKSSRYSNFQENFLQFNTKLIQALSSCVDTVTAKIQYLSIGIQQKAQSHVEADYIIEKHTQRLEELHKKNDLLTERLTNANFEKVKVMNELLNQKGRFRVLCKIRPLNHEESYGNSSTSWIRVIDNQIIEAYLPKAEMVENKSNTTEYSFHKVLGPETTQGDVFAEISELVDFVLEGKSVYVFKIMELMQLRGYI